MLDSVRRARVGSLQFIAGPVFKSRPPRQATS
jgi:hypothetical protein